MVTADNFQVPPHLAHLYAYLRANGLHRSRSATPAWPTEPILPRDVLALIQPGDPAWETQVPAPVVAVIKQKKLFGYAGGAAGA